jgi:uncharacterized protein
MTGSLSIAGVSCKPGEKQFKEIEIDSSNSLPTVLPLMLINGAHDGPSLCITAGMYGDEYPGIEAAIRAFNKTDADKLHGSLVILPVMNMPSFEWRTVGYSPVDRKDLNRVFPGNASGTVTERVARFIFEEVIMKVDFHLDLRGGDTNESHMTHTIMCRTGEAELDRASYDGARAFGLEYMMIHDAGKEGAMPGILLQEATKRGKPSIVSEIGIGLATFREEDIVLTERCMIRLLKHLKMLQGQPEPPPRIRVMRDGARVACSKGGIFYPLVEQTGPYFTALLKKGQKVGEVRDLRGAILETLYSPVDGVLHELLPKRVVFSGEVVILIRTIEKSSSYFR